MRLIDADKLKSVFNYLCEQKNVDMITLEAVEAIIDTAPTVTQLIPCSRELPKQQKKVLIQDGNDITIGYLNGENRWRDLTNLDDYLKAVTAWMPLPEPYKDDTK